MTLFDAGSPDPAVSRSHDPSPPAARAGPLVRVRMKVAYHGGGFRGFAAQPGQPTVGGALAQAVQTVVGCPVEVVCAGRTDAGVHAAGQVIHVDLQPAPDAAADGSPGADTPPGAVTVDTVGLRRSLNRMLGPRIVVLEADIAPPGFDARRSALWRRYLYTVLNRSDPDPFLAGTAWHVRDELDVRAMQLACDPIHGEHDFAAFCKKPANPRATTVRRVIRAGWQQASPDLLRFEVVASAFCHQMVRSLVGTIVDMGRGRKVAGDMAWILRSGDRSLAGPVAPPDGLVLAEVGYPADADLAVSAASRRGSRAPAGG